MQDIENLHGMVIDWYAVELIKLTPVDDLVVVFITALLPTHIIFISSPLPANENLKSNYYCLFFTTK